MQKASLLSLGISVILTTLGCYEVAPYEVATKTEPGTTNEVATSGLPPAPRFESDSYSEPLTQEAIPTPIEEVLPEATPSISNESDNDIASDWEIDEEELKELAEKSSQSNEVEDNALPDPQRSTNSLSQQKATLPVAEKLDLPPWIGESSPLVEKSSETDSTSINDGEEYPGVDLDLPPQLQAAENEIVTNQSTTQPTMPNASQQADAIPPLAVVAPPDPQPMNPGAIESLFEVENQPQEIPEQDQPFEESQSVENTFQSIEPEPPTIETKEPVRIAQEELYDLPPIEEESSQKLDISQPEVLQKEPKTSPARLPPPSDTQNLAWLLGGKMSLAMLASYDGAKGQEITGWINDSQILGEQLQVAPALLDFGSGTPTEFLDERILSLFRQGAKVSESIFNKYDTRHAALFEASLKANALLLIYRRRPDLTEPIVLAVRDALTRAQIEENLWRRPLADLYESQNYDEAYIAITTLFAAVGQSLN